MEIKKTVDGKEYGFRFSALTLELFSEKLNCEFSEIFDNLSSRPLSSVIDLVWCANTVYNKGEELSRYDIDEIIDKMDQGDLQDIWQVFEDEIPKIAGKFTKKKPEEKSGS